MDIFFLPDQVFKVAAAFIAAEFIDGHTFSPKLSG